MIDYSLRPEKIKCKGCGDGAAGHPSNLTTITNPEPVALRSMIFSYRSCDWNYVIIFFDFTDLFQTFVIEIFEKWLRFLRLITSIRGGTDVEGTISEISGGVRLRGANVWMLVCSAILASIGLDVNSTAVIIGAMLISPLMSPILGVGLGIGILDRILLRDSLRNLALATILSLATSFIYFLISPLGELTPELSARTTPTLLDVGVAFFGGVAGIVAGSRTRKTSAIPGVAIATALMPPLCTAGFGLAKFDSGVFLGAFYLYFINASFISLATYLITILLRFPKREQVDDEHTSRVRRYILGFAVLVTIPSGFIFYNVLAKLRFDQGVRNFVNTEIRRDDRQPIRWEVQENGTPRVLKIFSVGAAVDDQELNNLRVKMSDYGIAELQLSIVQMNVSPEEFRKISTNFETTITDNLKIISGIEEEQAREVENLKAEIESLRQDADPNLIFLRNVKNRFPELIDVKWIDAEPPAEGEPPRTGRRLELVFPADIGNALRTRIIRDAGVMARRDWPDETIPVVATAEQTETPETQ